MIIKKIIQNPELKEALEKCYEKGYFLNSGYGGVKLWSLEEEYKDTLKEKTKRKKEEQKKVRLTEKQEFWIKASKYFSELRDLRKELQQRAFYYMAELLKEIARITGFSRDDLEQLLVEQITKEKLENKEKLKETIKEQKKALLFCWVTKKGFYKKNRR